VTKQQQSNKNQKGSNLRVQQWRTVAGFLAMVVLVATLCFTAAYFLTAYIYGVVGQQPNAFGTQVINWIVGWGFFIIVMIIFGRINQGKRWDLQMVVFGPIFEAMAQIAKGDFNVQLDNQSDDNPLVNELTKRVNTMALELNRLEQMRQEFISDVSHEFQSPLTSIRGFAQALQNNDLDAAERKHYLTIIETESVRLSNLADNLLRLASLDAEQTKFEPRAYRLDKQIRNLILSAEPQWSAKSIQMDASLQVVTITADEEMLSQVWLNLIHNSIKFTPPGGTVCVELCQAEDKALVKISDTGIGIAEEDQSHIFERFYKADKSRQRSQGGNGLGLSIAHKIVELHHGSIAVSSQFGAGTTFTVTLPV
jgi:two-component system phosphate regulon sensor histidine kinase PhoR